MSDRLEILLEYLGGASAEPRRVEYSKLHVEMSWGIPFLMELAVPGKHVAGCGAIADGGILKDEILTIGILTLAEGYLHSLCRGPDHPVAGMIPTLLRVEM